MLYENQSPSFLSHDQLVKNSVNTESDRIHALDTEVINRIAAGEVVQRPCSALKELLENALDAGATQITVVAKSGGMKLLSVQDNGRGIHREDLPMLCKRFTTSKITCFEDLRKIQTFGFRGEALCSISHVSRLTVTSKRRGSSEECAFKAQYLNEEMVQCQPVAGLEGTLIIVEDLFYNTPIRLSSLKNFNEEYQNCVKVVSKYAVHNAARASFILKKHGQTKADVQTSMRPQISSSCDEETRKRDIFAQKDVIRTIYGNAIARELVEIEWSGPASLGSPNVRGFVSTTNYHSKSAMQFILFINHRLVKSETLKKSIESFYQEILPKQCYPFVYLSLSIDPESIDVNVHPTKSKVHFLYEKEISDLVRARLAEVLKVSNVSRSFYTQSQVVEIVPFENKKHALKSTPQKNNDIEKRISDDISAKKRSNPKTIPQKLVRTDVLQNNASLYAYLQHPEKNVFHSNVKRSKSFQVPESIEFILKEIDSASSHQLENIFDRYVYVGCVNYDNVLVQHSTKLYLLKFQLCR
jgi:DNA mismatch repair protein MLH1